MSDAFLSVTEVAERLRVSRNTVFRMVNDGEIESVRVGRQFRIREAALERYLDERTTPAGAVLT